MKLKKSGRIQNFFLNPDRFSGRNVMSDKANFRLGSRQNVFLKKIRTSRICVALKKFLSYCTLINIGKHMTISI